MQRYSLYFEGPGRVAVRAEALPAPGPGQLLIQTLFSAISPGTEMLVYRDQFPREVAVDATIAALAGTFAYPLKYGYAAVGRVAALGAGVPPEWAGRLVLAFHPHESHFLAEPAAVLPVPPGLAPEVATLLPNMETAVVLMLDGAPLTGEQVVVYGQGIVGLLLTGLLARLPLARLTTLDRHPRRRLASETLGAHASLDPAAAETLGHLRSLTPGPGAPPGADLTFEISGHPGALDQAIAVTGFHGRVVIGSWYGRKKVELDLGGDFHRSRMRLVSSQVSSLAPELTGRWTKARLLGLAWQLLRDLQPDFLITHTMPLAEAAAAYDLLDQRPGEAIQVLLQY